MKLFTPGPIDLMDNVKHALSKPLISHRTEDFHALFERCSYLTKQLFNNHNEYTPLFLTGSGTLSIESIIYSYLKNKKTLLIQNGSFSERWESCMNFYNCNFETLNYGWNTEFDFSEIENKAIDFECIFVVHHETSTTMINDINRIDKIAKKTNTKVIIDGVSSVGLYDIDLNILKNISFIGYSSNKCIGSVPGLAIVIARNTLLEEMNDDFTYLNLKLYYNFAKLYETPFTPCIQNMYCYKEALSNIVKYNKFELNNHYKELMQYLISKLRYHDIHPMLETNQCVWVCNFKINNPCMKIDKLYDRGYCLYKTKGHLQTQCVQIAIFNKSKSDIDALICEIVQTL